MKIVQQDLLHMKQFLKILWSEVWKGGILILLENGVTFNAVVVIGVVSLLLFKLPMAILWVATGLVKKIFSILKIEEKL